MVGGQNVWLGVLLRRILAPYIFKRCGQNFKCFQARGVLVRLQAWRWARTSSCIATLLLDDRGGIVLWHKVSISDYANIYSHTHPLPIVEQREVTNATTVIGDGVRITYHATVLAGVHVGETRWWAPWRWRQGTCGPTTSTLGIPAKKRKVKPNAAARAPGERGRGRRASAAAS